MCIEQSFKRGGISIIRNFLHQTEGIKAGLPQNVQSRLNFSFKLKKYQAGKVQSFSVINDISTAFKGKGDSK